MAALFLGFYALKNYERDPMSYSHLDSVGMVAAIKEEDRGSRAVVIKPNGEILENKQWKAPTVEDSVSWMADGNRLVFSSDRGGRSQNLFYWLPEKDETQKFQDQSRSMTAPWFEPNDPTNKTGIMMSGGNVWEFIPEGRKARQILPPLVKSAVNVEEGGGRQSTMDAIYHNLGTSFKSAYWAGGRAVILAVMRRDEGEICVINYTEPGPDGKTQMPRGFVAGSRVEIDSDGGQVCVVAVHDFKWPDPDNIPQEFIKDGRTTRPYKNAVMVLQDVASASPKVIPIIAAPDDSDQVYSYPTVSPDGSKLLVVLGKQVGDNKVEPVGMLVMPVKEQGGAEAALLVRGEVSDPSWSPDGKKIVYVKRDDEGDNSIYTIGADGGGEARLAQGNFLQPKFSPQVKKS